MALFTFWRKFPEICRSRWTSLAAEREKREGERWPPLQFLLVRYSGRPSPLTRWIPGNWYCHPSIHPPIHPFIQPPIHSPIHLFSIHPSIHFQWDSWVQANRVKSCRHWGRDKWTYKVNTQKQFLVNILCLLNFVFLTPTSWKLIFLIVAVHSMATTLPTQLGTTQSSTTHKHRLKVKSINNQPLATIYTSGIMLIK